MMRPLAHAIVFLAVLSSGLVNGFLTHRWDSPDDLAGPAGRLQDVPMALGEWDGHSLELGNEELTAAEAAGYLRRRYVNRVTGSAVSLLVLCGRPGPISVHRPEICYPGAGFETVGAPSRFSEPALAGSEFLVYRFQKPRATLPVNVRLLHSWSATGVWTVPDDPRMTFARHPVLYKLYVIRELPRGDEPLQDDPLLDFIRLLLPELRKTLFPGS